MPLYQYSCTKCGHVFDKFQSLTFRSSAQCPECRELAARQYTPVSFSFGWRLSDESLNDVNSTKPDYMERDI